MQKKRNISEVALPELEASKIAHAKHSAQAGKSHTTKTRNKADKNTKWAKSRNDGDFQKRKTENEEQQLDEIFALL